MRHHLQLTLLLFICYSFIPRIANAQIFPVPQIHEIKTTQLSIQGDRIVVDAASFQKFAIQIDRIKQSLGRRFDNEFTVTAGTFPGEVPAVSFQIAPKTTLEPQGYKIDINESGIKVVAHDDYGLYYSIQTLEKILSKADKSISCQTIHDWPDFERRGIMLDISRDKVPTMETLKLLIDRFAAWKINEIQLYVEHTFAYKNHKEVWKDASPLTVEEVLELDQYCGDRMIDLVPNQNSLGHMGRWLKHSDYFYLSERPDSIASDNWIINKRRTTLCAVEPKSISFMDSLYAEYLPNFTSKYANIGGDEPYELGYGRSKEMCDKIGKSKVYLNYIKEVTRRVKQYGKQPQMWGDIVTKHPELIPLMPKDVICMIWGYRPNHPYEKQCRRFHDEQLPFYVCPGTSGWRTFIGKTERAKQNIQNAIVNGKKYGAYGVLNTNWGDKGHMQPISTAFPPLIYGAGMSWCVDHNKDVDLAKLTNDLIYKDPTNNMGEGLLQLTNAYMGGKGEDQAGRPYFDMIDRIDVFFSDKYRVKFYDPTLLPMMRKEVAEATKKIAAAKPTSVDGQITKDELLLSAKLATWGCELIEARLKVKDHSIKNIPLKKRKRMSNQLNEIITEFENNWVKRNRIGGLSDSVERLASVSQELIK
ncbi:family 20 glycosylhydrolase [Halosquirtibacter xylanolyticus]|uniref:beta-N-acetylhexosaminidase n=1 Tax=Halosquirtibacter xylanolyticus TaxID=3374599 RepID=UPI0037488DDD|nr:family 20 glycosylhydrolase [Prolixibacteraceae bacterium]